MSFWESLKKDLEVAPAGYWLVVDDASPEQLKSEIATLGWTYLGEITSAEAITAAAKTEAPGALLANLTAEEWQSLEESWSPPAGKLLIVASYRQYLLVSQEAEKWLRNVKVERSERYGLLGDLERAKEELAADPLNSQALETASQTAHRLHTRLTEQGKEPQHNRYVLRNREVPPSDPKFYAHRDPIEDLIKIAQGESVEGDAVATVSNETISTSTPGKIRGVVTFLDVLGWQGIYTCKQNPIRELKQIIDDIGHKAKLYPRGTDLDITVTSISDTLILTAQCEDLLLSRAVEIHGYLCAHLIRTSIKHHLPMRGATAYGEFDKHDNIFVGQAVDEAAAWHEQADWIGVHLTPSAQLSFKPGEGSVWRKYRVPSQKNRVQWEPYCVDWTTEGVEELKIEEHFLKMGPIVPDIAGKFLNTLHFLQETRSRKDKGSQPGGD